MTTPPRGTPPRPTPRHPSTVHAPPNTIITQAKITTKNYSTGSLQPLHASAGEFEILVKSKSITISHLRDIEKDASPDFYIESRKVGKVHATQGQNLKIILEAILTPAFQIFQIVRSKNTFDYFELIYFRRFYYR